MWVITTEGFFSAVEHRDDPDRIMVRARAKADLERLRKATGLTFRIKRSQDWADYPYRTTISRADWVESCAVLAGDVDYANFKDAVGARRGKTRAGVYMSVWASLRRIEPPRKLKLPKWPGKKSLGVYYVNEKDGERGCVECGVFLLSAERLSEDGDGRCEWCVEDATEVSR